MKKTAVVVCPGRGTYNKDELAYLKTWHAQRSDFIEAMDAYRRDQGQVSIRELDEAARFQPSLHLRGDNASALIYTCAMADFLSINRDQYEIVAVTGNSMGWYLALAAGAAVDLNTGMHIVNSMGTLMHNHAPGSQILFPLCDENWCYDASLAKTLENVIGELKHNPAVEIYASIELGAMAVLAANDEGARGLMETLPKVQDRYPLALPYHAAFHSPLMKPVSETASQRMDVGSFTAPQIPLIDGRGHIWQPYLRDIQALYDYTFGHQVCATYNYSKAIEVACKEFAPDYLVILGPGTTLGAPTAQQLIKMHWHNIDSKQRFKNRQASNPFILSMGIESQRCKLT